MRKLYYIILALFFIGIASSCSFAPLENFKNPADPGSESYQGYMVVDDPNQIIAETKEDLYLSELRFLVSKVVGAQEYQLQIANDDSFSDIAYENSFASNILEPDASKSHLRRYWRVRAKVADVWGNWGSIKSFIYLHSQTLYFDSQGGSTPEAYKEVSEGSSYGILTTPSRNGYSFEGWWSEPDGAGIQITSETTVATNSGHVVYAKWIPQYTVTFDSQGGFDPSPTSKVVTSGQTYGALAAVTRNDYVFDGWWTGISGAGEEILSTTQVTLSSNQTLYAKWIPQYTVTFDSQGGFDPSPTSKVVTSGQTYGALATVTRNDYVFDGWWTGINGAGEEILSTTQVTLSSNQTLYAKWIPQYTVTFDSQGGFDPSPTSKVVTSGQTYGTLPNAVRNGYMFDGWWTGINGTGEEIQDTTEVTILFNQMLYAKWVVIVIGSLGPSGGYVFYDKGDYSDGWRYMEAAPAGWSGGSRDPYYIFGNHDYLQEYDNWTVLGTDTGIGSGKTNTDTLVAAMGNAAFGDYGSTTNQYAAKICADYRGGGYNDWFLPSKDELNQIYQNLYRNNIGGFFANHYWSSSERNACYVWYQRFDFGLQEYTIRNLAYWVRPVRAF